MKKLNNKGFTIVELVIVVAVIAILAAVLIPTVSGLVKTAQTSADVTLVKNVNLVLATERALEGKNTTMQEALDDALEGGYDVTKLTPTNSDNYILWDQESDNFVLFANGKYNNAGAEVKVTDEYKLWNIADKTEGSKYSIYYIGDETEVDVNGVGFDVGTSSVATVNYVNTTGTVKNVVIRTNSANTNLNIDAATDTVNHYGNVGKVDVQKIDMNCYNEYGTAAYVKVTEGRVVVKAGGEIAVAYASTASAEVVVEGGAVEQNFPSTAVAEEVEAIAQEAINEAIAKEAFAGVSIAKDGEETILMTLADFRDSVNGGNSYEGYTVTLMNDIDLGGVEWTPIGTTEHPFSGVFDGQSYTIKNYKIRGEGEDVGLALFGCIKGTASTLTYTTDLSDFYNTTNYTVNLPAEEIFTCVVKNLNVSGADVDTTAEGWTAAVVAYVEDATISNIRLSNSVITAGEKVGGIVGYLPDKYACYITNCTTSSNVTVTASTGHHSAGILGNVYSISSRGIIANCTNNATINCAGVNGGGIAGQAKNVLFYNNTNNGSVTGKTRAAGIATDCSGSVFINCTNKGYIKTTAVYSIISDSSAGIASYLATSGNNVIVNCHNSGTIEGNAPKDNTKIAGIVAGGVLEGDTIINNSNTGTLINHAENGKVYDICNLSSVAYEVNAEDLDAINAAIATDNKYIRFTGDITIAAGDTVAFNGQEKIEFVHSPSHLTLDLSGANKSSFILMVNDTVVTLKNGGDNYVTISGKGNTVKVDENETVKYLTVLNDDTQSASSINILGNATRVVLKGNGLVNGEIAQSANVERINFSGNGTFTLTNRGTISHTTSGIYGNEHTIDTLTSCNITIHNYGTIEAKENSANVASYAFLFFGGATVKLYAYNGSNIIAEGNMGVIMTSGGTQVNVYYEDGAEVTSYDSQSTYPKAFGYFCTVTVMN